MLVDLTRLGTAEAAAIALQPRYIFAVFIGSLALGLWRYFTWSAFLYWYFYKRLDANLRQRKLQAAAPRSGQIAREIRWSLASCLVFALLAVSLYTLAWQHKTRLYLNIETHGWGYFLLSLVTMLILHDAYFYWTHRLSHSNRWLFRRIHRIHHQSLNPTPYADIMFHPLDALLHVGFVPLFLFTIPLHPLAIGLFITLVSLVNAVGHIGFEVFSPRFMRRFRLGWISQATAHNLHHSKVHCNYGLYFNFWDKLCGTYHPQTQVLFEAKGAYGKRGVRNSQSEDEAAAQGPAKHREAWDQDLSLQAPQPSELVGDQSVAP